MDQQGQGPASHLQLGVRRPPSTFRRTIRVDATGSRTEPLTYELPEEGSYYATLSVVEGERERLLYRSRGFWFPLAPNRKTLERLSLRLGEIRADLARLPEGARSALEGEGDLISRGLDDCRRGPRAGLDVAAVGRAGRPALRDRGADRPVPAPRAEHLAARRGFEPVAVRPQRRLLPGEAAARRGPARAPPGRGRARRGAERAGVVPGRPSSLRGGAARRPGGSDRPRGPRAGDHPARVDRDLSRGVREDRLGLGLRDRPARVVARSARPAARAVLGAGPACRASRCG